MRTWARSDSSVVAVEVTEPGPVASVPTAVPFGDLEAAAFGVPAAVPGRVLIDVRTPQEFAEGHLEGAANIDFYAPDFATQIAALDQSKEYAIYCQSGNRSGQTAKLMQAAGIDKVFNLAGRITAWTAAGMATVG